MSRFISRLTALETRSRHADATILGDDEVLEAFKQGIYETRHVDELFRIIEPALLGYLILAAVSIRPELDRLLADRQYPLHPMQAAYWVMAFGNGVESDVADDLAKWEKWFDEPIHEKAASRDRRWHMWDAHEGIVKRLFRKHGLGNLRSAVKAICDASTEDRQTLIEEFVPRADKSRRDRMARISAPLRPFIGWHHHTFRLLVLSPDANEILYLEDNTGQEWTLLPHRGEEGSGV